MLKQGKERPSLLQQGREARAERHSTLRRGRALFSSTAAMSSAFSSPTAQGGGRKRKLKEAEQDVDSNHSGGEDGNGGSSAVQDMARTQELMNRIAEVEDEKRTILEGSHPEWMRKKEALERIRERRIYAADQFKQHQIDNIGQLYEYEVMEADATYKTAVEDLKTRLLEAMEQRVKKLEEDRERVLKQLERVGQARVLRSKHSFKGAGEESVDGAITIPLPKPGAEFDKFVPNVPLKDGEIKEDLTAIMGDLADRAKAFYNAKDENMYDVAVEDGVLHYGDHCLIKGESLCFTSMLSGEDFFGRIASVRPHEVLVKLTDGTKARINLSYLKNGRIKLKVDDDMFDD